MNRSANKFRKGVSLYNSLSLSSSKITIFFYLIMSCVFVLYFKATTRDKSDVKRNHAEQVWVECGRGLSRKAHPLGAKQFHSELGSWRRREERSFKCAQRTQGEIRSGPQTSRWPVNVLRYAQSKYQVVKNSGGVSNSTNYNSLCSNNLNCFNC